MHTKDSGESWDSALIGKPFNILKVQSHFSQHWGASVGAGGGGEHALFSRKPLSSYKQMGAFPCVYIVHSYLGAGWNHATPPQADTAMRLQHQALLPWRIQNVESQPRGAPPLLPEPILGCKTPTAAGKLSGSSSGVGIAATPHYTRHQPLPARVLVPRSWW